MLKKLKALWEAKKMFEWFKENYRREVKTMDETTATPVVKPGWKTSEFYLTLISQLLTVVAALNGVIDPKTGAIVVAALTGIYNVLRALVKQPEITTLSK